MGPTYLSFGFKPCRIELEPVFRAILTAATYLRMSPNVGTSYTTKVVLTDRDTIDP